MGNNRSRLANNIRERHSDLLNIIDIDFGLLDELCSLHVLTYEQLTYIQDLPSRAKRIEHLLKYILSHELRVAKYELRVASCEWQSTSYASRQVRVASGKVRVTSRQVRVASGKVRVTSTCIADVLISRSRKRIG
jgi:hypothetical protein